ncbi:MAG: hypothetical protein V3R87_10845 [Dehalococcoidia bacterium]
MKFFWSRRKKKPPRKRSPDQELRRQEARRKKLATDILEDLAKNSPQVQQALVAAEFGLELPVLDPVADAQKKFHLRVFEMLDQHLDRFPEHAEPLLARVLRNKLDELTPEEQRDKRGPNERFEDEVRRMERWGEFLKKQAAGKWQDELPGVFVAFAKAFAERQTAAATNAAGPSVPAKTDGSELKAPKPIFLRPKAEGSAPPAGGIDNPKSQGSDSSAQTVGQPDSSPPVGDGQPPQEESGQQC